VPKGRIGQSRAVAALPFWAYNLNGFCVCTSVVALSFPMMYLIYSLAPNNRLVFNSFIGASLSSVTNSRQVASDFQFFGHSVDHIPTRPAIP